jgi:hypothetical protein
MNVERTSFSGHEACSFDASNHPAPRLWRLMQPLILDCDTVSEILKGRNPWWSKTQPPNLGASKFMVQILAAVVENLVMVMIAIRLAFIATDLALFATLSDVRQWYYCISSICCKSTTFRGVEYVRKNMVYHGRFAWFRSCVG